MNDAEIEVDLQDGVDGIFATQSAVGTSGQIAPAAARARAKRWPVAAAGVIVSAIAALAISVGTPGHSGDSVSSESPSPRKQTSEVAFEPPTSPPVPPPAPEASSPAPPVRESALAEPVAVKEKVPARGRHVASGPSDPEPRRPVGSAVVSEQPEVVLRERPDLPDHLVLRFEIGRSDLDRRQRARLQDWGRAVEQMECERVAVRGHSCSLGTPVHNANLARRRARAAEHTLRDAGVAEARLRVSSAGSNEPIVRGRSKAAYRANRRVTITCERGTKQ